MKPFEWLNDCCYTYAKIGCFVLAALLSQGDAAQRAQSQSTYFRIQVVDEQTGRGVPLVFLKTTNEIVYVTDSHGIVAFYEPGLMDQTVYFHIRSDGYDYPSDGFGYRGKAIRIEPGGQETLRIKRLNIAERLYRITGQGIYRDSLLTGDPTPLIHPVINGRVTGQDTVFTCLYKDTLFWFWGDTNRPSYPLGHFATAAATSLLPSKGGLDPDRGINLTYFTDDSGFSRPIAPLPDSGMVWVQGLLTADDNHGTSRMLLQYTRLTSLTEAVERGWMAFDDDSERFEPIRRSDPDFLLYDDVGHPLAVHTNNDSYYYFATPFPLGVRLRARTDWADLTDPDRYEVYTALHNTDDTKTFGWVDSKRLLSDAGGNKRALIKSLQQEKHATGRLYDIETGNDVIPHNGTVYWNDYLDAWIMIAVQQGGSTSYLGEVWFAQSDTPVGPWHYARKIVTHNAYSFYNPKHHYLFDQEGGRVIYFEGTYTHTFSGQPELATPRYDYNQIMYRLDLSDKRLALPTAIYQLRHEGGRLDYRPAKRLENSDPHPIETVAFYAMTTDSDDGGSVAVYQIAEADEKIRLTTRWPAPDAIPLFYGRSDDSLPATVALHEYRHRSTGHVRYSTDPMDAAVWKKKDPPICYVWPNRSASLIADFSAGPAQTP